MKALSVRQPWTWLILHAGKNIENRDWRPHYPGLADARRLASTGERILIHAGKGMTRDEYESALHTAHLVSRAQPFPSGLTLPAHADLPRGAIVGSARIADIVRHSDSPWFFGPIGLLLADVTALSAPIPCKGALGFFDVPHDVLALANAESATGEADG